MGKIFLGKNVPPDSFVGREDVLTELKPVIYQGMSTELIGPHRSGKSALCRFLCKKLEDEGEILPFMVDLQHLPNPRFRSAVRSITGTPFEVDADLSKDFLGNDEEAVRILVEFAMHKEQPMVIFVDEMDLGASNRVYYNEWNSCLRSISHEVFRQDCEDISIIRVFSYNPDIYGDMHKHMFMSQSIGKEGKIRMKPFTKEQAVDLFKYICKNEQVNANFAYDYSGKFPFLIELMAFEANRCNLCDNVNYAELLEKVYDRSKSFYSDLYNYIDSTDNPISTIKISLLSIAFKDVVNAQKTTEPAKKLKFDLDDYELNILVDLGVINEIKGEKVIFSPLFSWWLTRKAVLEPSYDKVILEKVANFAGVHNLKDLVGLAKATVSTSTAIATFLA